MIWTFEHVTKNKQEQLLPFRTFARITESKKLYISFEIAYSRALKHVGYDNLFSETNSNFVCPVALN